MAIKFKYSNLLDEVNPSLQAISKLEFPISVPVSHHMAIAQNLNEIEKVAKAFWDTRDKLLKSLCEKDEKGEPVIEVIENLSAYKFTDKNRVLWDSKFNELRSEEVEVELKNLKQEHFEGVSGLKPELLKGILPILE